MADKIEFVRNYSDLSTNKGFQFEFYCDRCGSGYRTHFKPSVTGTMTSMLDAAGSLLGGIFNSAADVGQRVQSVTWEKAHDAAFDDACTELKKDFIQCPHCLSWVCRRNCWNEKNGLCKECAPDLGVEMAAAQSSKSVEEVWAHAAMAEEDKKLGVENWRETIRATCPKCEAPLQTNAKFCPECGARLKDNTKCSGCGTKLSPGTKFCPECGQKI